MSWFAVCSEETYCTFFTYLLLNSDFRSFRRPILHICILHEVNVTEVQKRKLTAVTSIIFGYGLQLRIAGQPGPAAAYLQTTELT